MMPRADAISTLRLIANHSHRIRSAGQAGLNLEQQNPMVVLLCEARTAGPVSLLPLVLAGIGLRRLLGDSAALRGAFNLSGLVNPTIWAGAFEPVGQPVV
jgi:hypothetical protein